jgi:hypothetical protein
VRFQNGSDTERVGYSRTFIGLKKDELLRVVQQSLLAVTDQQERVSQPEKVDVNQPLRRLYGRA